MLIYKNLMYSDKIYLICSNREINISSLSLSLHIKPTQYLFSINKFGIKHISKNISHIFRYFLNPFVPKAPFLYPLNT